MEDIDTCSSNDKVGIVLENEKGIGSSCNNNFDSKAEHKVKDKAMLSYRFNKGIEQKTYIVTEIIERKTGETLPPSLGDTNQGVMYYGETKRPSIIVKT